MTDNSASAEEDGERLRKAFSECMNLVFLDIGRIDYATVSEALEMLRRLFVALASSDEVRSNIERQIGHLTSTDFYSAACAAWLLRRLATPKDRLPVPPACRVDRIRTDRLNTGCSARSIRHRRPTCRWSMRERHSDHRSCKTIANTAGRWLAARTVSILRMPCSRRSRIPG